MSRTLKSGAALALALLLYALSGFVFVPRLAENQLERAVQDRLGMQLSVGSLRFNPFLFTIDADDVAVRQPRDDARAAPLLSLHLHADLDLWSSLFEPGWIAGDVSVDQAGLDLDVAPNGRPDLAELAQRWRETAPPGQSQAPAFHIRRLTVNGGAVRLHDRSGNETVMAQLSRINARFEDIGTLPQLNGRGNLTATLGAAATVAWEGSLTLSPLRSDGALQLQELPVAMVWKFFSDKTRLALPEGILQASSRYSLSTSGAHTALSLSRLAFTLAEPRLQLQRAERPLLTLEALSAQGGRFTLKDRSLHFDNLTLAQGRVSVVQQESGTLNWLSLGATDNPADADPRGITELRSQADNARGEVPFTLHVSKVRVDDVAIAYEESARPVPLQFGTDGLEGTATLALSTTGELAITDAVLAARGVRLQTGRTAPLTLDRLSIQDAHFDLRSRSVAASALALQGGKLDVVRTAKGQLTLAALLQGGQRTATDTPWSYALGRLAIDGLTLDFTDRTFGPPLAFRFDEVKASARNIDAAGGPVPVQLSAAMGGRQVLRAEGSIAAGFDEAAAQLHLDGVPLGPLDTLLQSHLRARLDSGTLSGSARLTWRRQARPMLDVEGVVTVWQLRINEEKGQTTLVGWNRLRAEGLQLTLAPDALQVKQVLIEEPQAQVAISANREFNLAQLLKARDKPAAGGSDRFPVRVDTLKVEKGAVDFSDASLVLPFATRVTQLQGTVSGLDTDPQHNALLSLRGGIGEFGEARVEGRLNAFSPMQLADLDVNFDNVPLPTLSPYSATFLGRTLAAGRLWLDLHYLVENSQLTGENEITIRDLKLGEKVDAPVARDLPLDLAVALLTDSQGRLTTDLTVTGNLDNPEFNVGTLVREALGNLVQKVVTAPFRAIARLFGGGEQDADNLAAIQFPPGSTRIAPPEREKLEKVRQALAERPMLDLVIAAPYDPESDALALREAQARRQLSDALGRPTSEVDTPVDLDDPRVVQNLRRLLADSPASQGASTRNDGDPSQLGGAQLFERLAAMQTLEETALQRLAAQRAQAIADYLAEQGLPRVRLTTGRLSPMEGAAISAQLGLSARTDGLQGASREVPAP